MAKTFLSFYHLSFHLFIYGIYNFLTILLFILSDMHSHKNTTMGTQSTQLPSDGTVVTSGSTVPGSSEADAVKAGPCGHGSLS